MAHGGAGTALPYVAAFDGLRALAVLAVVAYHASLEQVPGGFFGVDVFFVISGYLVTALFLARATPPNPGGLGIPDAAGTRDFWRRRLTRLVPASVGAVAFTWVVFALLGVRDPGTLTAEAVSALGYVANWFFLVSDQSYFETIASPSPFLHFWSLAVEAQFYLVWPVLLIAALRFGGRLAAFALAISLAAVSTVVVASLYDPTTDPSRAYYGTDARVAGLLLGAALAIVVRPALAARAPRIPVEVTGWAGVAALLLLVTHVSEFDAFIYRGGFFVAAAASLAVLFAALHGTNTLARLLAVMPLRWLGERSYSIYLWHWPIFVLSQPQLSADLQSPSLLLARLGATLVLAELSYRLVENQFRGGRAGWTLPRWDLGSGSYLQRGWARSAGVVSIGVIAVVVAGGLPVRSGLAGQMEEVSRQFQAAPLAAVADGASGTGDLVGTAARTEGEPPPSDLAAVAPGTTLDVTEATPTLTGLADTTAPGAGAALAPAGDVGDTGDDPVHAGVGSASSAEGAPESPTPSPTSTATTAAPPESTATAVPGVDLALSSAVASSGSVSATPAEVKPEAAPDPAVLGAAVTVIGDSVALGAVGALRTALPGAVVDAEVGRQFWNAPAVLAGLVERGALGDVVVLHLGSNGPFSAEQFARIVEVLDGRALVLVNVTVPRRWEGEVNRALLERVEQLPSAILADWNARSRTEPEFFSADGVHLTTSGQAAYAALVAEAVARAIAARG